MRSGSSLLIGLCAIAACDGKSGPPDPTPLPRCETPISGSNVTARRISQVNGAALLVTAPREDARLFVIEQNGRIRIIDEGGALISDPFLDITEGYELAAGGESGLLGLAFHPDYHVNGSYFIFYTTNAANIVARCQVDPSNANRSLPACTTVLSIPDFASNHNGGMIEFGRDGYLYIGTGDGGGGGDPNRNSQATQDGQPMANTVAMLGKILRIDIDRKDAPKQYAIPSDNPYATSGGAKEIYMLGLRNPWRWAFDKETYDMWIGDVGQEEIEELNAVQHGKLKGVNFGWSMYEGTSCYRTGQCTPTNVVMPVDEHSHNDNWLSVIGGDVYRGTCYPDMVGWHYYTDFYAGGLLRAKLNSDGTVTKETVAGTFPRSVTSIHTDARHELYMTTASGEVYHLEVAPP